MLYFQKELVTLVDRYKELIKEYEVLIAEGEIARVSKDYDSFRVSVENANEFRKEEVMPLERKLDILTNLVQLEMKYVDACNQTE